MKPSRDELLALEFGYWQVTLKFGFLAYVQHYARLGVECLVFCILSWRWGPKTKYVTWRHYVTATWRNFDALKERIRLGTKRIDPRDMETIPLNRRVRCKNCNILTTSKYPACWLCGENIWFGRTDRSIGPGIFMKHGAKLFGKTEMTRINDANQGQGAIDLLQPTRHYDKSTKKWHTNPDFVKHYGDPFAGDSESH